MSNQLEQLSRFTSVVADTGDINAIVQFKPEDATTNPSLILGASKLPEYEAVFSQAIDFAIAQGGSETDQVNAASDFLAVSIGAEIVKQVPGLISTEVDARLSYDTQGSIAKAKQLIALYESKGIDKSRVLIKLASTWQGIKAAEQLELEGIRCNLTLLFSFAQAQACAQANVYLVSPFVGRIYDWYKKQNGVEYTADNDPGVASVTKIYQFYKQYGYSTVVMGASFRNVGQIIALAGCDKLTIGPGLLAQLEQSNETVSEKLSADVPVEPKPTPLTEADFYWQHNQDPMAVEKLAEGIRLFAADQEKLEVVIRERLQARH
ncbi:MULTISPECIES: transaldolase [unclassified Motilimonas]|uniref:transaldolase n=1 Tax=unclassified Motilimonas TaxID=2643697 RepID=UPI001E5658EE|nr:MULTISPECIES: transaldolase [unclassified Motilimonas]MCE0558435.1 transaldolase [Motilimonas sp. E26]MDO6526593.1 transaldolase [Motilimonas sp. 1_MG-2023]